MDIKKFEAYSMQDAIKMVRQDLGKDAVILSSKEKYVSTSEGDSSKQHKIIEIVATKSAQSSATKSDKTIQQPNFPRVQKADAAVVVKGNQTPTLRTPNAETKRLAQALAPQLQAHPQRPMGPSAGLGGVKSGGLSMAQQPGGFSSEVKADFEQMREEIRRLRQDIAQIPQLNLGDQLQDLKIMVHDLLRRDALSDESAYPPALHDLGVKLRTGGVSESVISLVFQETDRAVQMALENKSVSSDKIKEIYLNTAIKVILKKMNLYPFLNETNNASQLPYICCLVGPAGSGKTTAIAKAAAYLKLEKKKKIAFISLDTYRIAGSDQLRIYSKILECPFLEASEPSEILPFIKKHCDASAIFIDTPGNIPSHKDTHAPLSKVLQLQVPIHLHLVLPSSMKQRDLDEIIQEYQGLGVESLLFTKLDESWAYGEIFTAAARSKLPLSYFSVGQRVPEDFVNASKEKIVERLFSL